MVRANAGTTETLGLMVMIQGASVAAAPVVSTGASAMSPLSRASTGTAGGSGAAHDSAGLVAVAMATVSAPAQAA